MPTPGPGLILAAWYIQLLLDTSTRTTSQHVPRWTHRCAPLPSQQINSRPEMAALMLPFSREHFTLNPVKSERHTPLHLPAHSPNAAVRAGPGKARSSHCILVCHMGARGPFVGHTWTSRYSSRELSGKQRCHTSGMWPPQQWFVPLHHTQTQNGLLLGTLHSLLLSHPKG